MKKKSYFVIPFLILSIDVPTIVVFAIFRGLSVFVKVVDRFC